MAPELQSFLQLLIQAFITAAVPIIVYLIRQFVDAKLAEIRMRMSLEQQERLDLIIATFVQAAEQSGTIGLIRKEGQAKKTWVIQQTQRELMRLGLPGVNATVIGDLIEAKIHEGWNLPEKAG